MPGGEQAAVKLRILVVAEGRVVAADRPKGGDPHQRVVPMLDPRALAQQPVRRPAVPDPRVLRVRDHALQESLPLRLHRDDDAVGPALRRFGQHHVAEIGRIGAVGIQPQKPVAPVAEPLDRKVHGGGLQAARVVDQPDPVVAGGAGAHDLAGAVARPAIGNHHQRVVAGGETGDPVQHLRDMRFLVQGRDDDQHLDGAGIGHG